MEDMSLWTTKETNNYLYKQMKTILEQHGFVVSTFKSKYLARIREHHIQIVCPEVLYGTTRLIMFVVPAFSYCNYLYCGRRMYLKRNIDSNRQDNCYDKIAIRDEGTGKAWYQPKEIQRVWTEAIAPQIEIEVIDYFDTFGFPEFIHLSQNQLNGILSYCGCPVNDDALRFLTMAYNAIWMEDYDSSLPLLKRAVLGYEKYEKNSVVYNREVDLEQQLNKAVAKEIIEVIESQREGWEAIILDRLCLLEKDAPKKAWGIALDEHDKTLRVKKKK